MRLAAAYRGSSAGITASSGIIVAVGAFVIGIIPSRVMGAI